MSESKIEEKPQVGQQDDSRAKNGRISTGVTVSVEDWQHFGSLETLPQKAGVPIEWLPRLVLKELVDNACDGRKATDATPGGLQKREASELTLAEVRELHAALLEATSAPTHSALGSAGEFRSVVSWVISRCAVIFTDNGCSGSLMTPRQKSIASRIKSWGSFAALAAASSPRAVWYIRMASVSVIR